MDEKKQRARKLQAKMEKAGDTEQDAQQIVMQAEGFGLAKNRDVDDPFEAVDALMSVREDENDFPDILSAPILRDSTNNGKYRIDEQQFSLLFLEVFQQDNGKGELIPRYSMVGGMLGIPPSTLRKWWSKRDFISAQSAAVVEKGLGYVGTAFMVELIRMIQALGKIDYSKYNPNIVEDIMSSVVSLAMPLDLASLWVGGKAGQMAVTPLIKYMQKKAGQKITQAGVQSMAGLSLAQKAIVGAGKQAPALGVYEAAIGGVQAKADGKDASEITKATVDGLIHGSILGAVTGGVATGGGATNACCPIVFCPTSKIFSLNTVGGGGANCGANGEAGANCGANGDGVSTAGACVKF